MLIVRKNKVNRRSSQLFSGKKQDLTLFLHFGCSIYISLT